MAREKITLAQLAADALALGDLTAGEALANLIAASIGSSLLAPGAALGNLANGSIPLAKLAATLDTANLTANAVSRTWVVQAAPSGSTTSGTKANMPSPFDVLTLTGYAGGPLIVMGVLTLLHTIATANASFNLTSGGVNILNLPDHQFVYAGRSMAYPFLAYFAALGTSNVGIQWATNSGTLSYDTAHYGWMVVLELKR